MNLNDELIDEVELERPRRPRLLTPLRQRSVRKHLLLGLPAVIAAAAMVTVACAAALTDANQLRRRYFDEASWHFNRRNYEAARVGFERIVREGWDLGSSEVRYNLAVCLDVLGQPDRAAALIDELTPDDHVGFGPAHVWRARSLWSGTNHTPAEIRAGEEHLLRALQDTPGATEPCSLLGQYYLAAGRARQAIPYLEAAARESEEMLLPLARAELAADRRMSARERAKDARLLFRRRAEADLDDHSSRLLWVDADLILEDFADAVDALQREALLKSDERYPKALAQVYLAWADSLAREGPSKLAERLLLLERGLALDPANMQLLGRFSDVIRAAGAEGERAARRSWRLWRMGQRRARSATRWASTPGSMAGPPRPGCTGKRPAGSRPTCPPSSTTWPGSWVPGPTPTCPAPWTRSTPSSRAGRATRDSARPGVRSWPGCSAGRRRCPIWRRR